MSSHAVSGDQRARLHELHASTVRRLASLVSNFDGIVEAATDVATDDEHDPEGHTIAWERQQTAALLDEARIMFTAIEAAHTRLDDGIYDSCTTCSATITVERLDVFPTGSSWFAWESLLPWSGGGDHHV